MTLRPLGDKVVIKQMEAEEKTKSGIVLPTQSKEKPQEAEVIAVGPGGMVYGEEVVMWVKPGDKVISVSYTHLKAMIQVGHELNMTILAEGVETDEQVKILQDINCDVIQGFKFFQPLPKWEANKQIAENYYRK